MCRARAFRSCRVDSGKTSAARETFDCSNRAGDGTRAPAKRRRRAAWLLQRRWMQRIVATYMHTRCGGGLRPKRATCWTVTVISTYFRAKRQQPEPYQSRAWSGCCRRRWPSSRPLLSGLEALRGLGREGRWRCRKKGRHFLDVLGMQGPVEIRGGQDVPVAAQDGRPLDDVAQFPRVARERVFPEQVERVRGDLRQGLAVLPAEFRGKSGTAR